KRKFAANHRHVSSDMSDAQWGAKALSGGQTRRQAAGVQRPGHDQRHLLRTSRWLPNHWLSIARAT
ncbi:MAG: hypothetical protein ACTTKK_09245, partial [Ottowia sp.]